MIILYLNETQHIWSELKLRQRLAIARKLVQRDLSLNLKTAK